MPPAPKSYAADFGVVNEKIDSLADTVGKLAEVVAEDRKNSIENTRQIFSEIANVRDRATSAGRITWPLIVTTFSAALAFAAIVGGIGTYALSETRTQLKTEIEANKLRLNAEESKSDVAVEVRAQNRERLAKVEEWQRLHENGSQLLTSDAVAAGTLGRFDDLREAVKQQGAVILQLQELKGTVGQLRDEVTAIDERGSRRWNSDNKSPE